MAGASSSFSSSDSTPEQHNSHDPMLGAACPVMMLPRPPLMNCSMRNSHDPMFVGTVCSVRMLRPRP